MKDKIIENNIKEFGWHCLNVFYPDDGKPEFTYSIGFEETYNHPEIMMFGLEADKSHHMLADIAHDIKNGVILKTDVRLKNVIGGDYEVMFKEIKQESFGQYLGTAVDYYEKPFRAWVMLWPDKHNILPTESGCLATDQNEALGIII